MVNAGKDAGMAAIAGAVGFVALAALSMAAYPGYSFSDNYLSDLGAHPAAGPLFFAALFLVSTALWFVALVGKTARILPAGVCAALFVTGLGLDGVALFPKTVEPFHTLSAGLAFLSAGAAGLLLAGHWRGKSKIRAAVAAAGGAAPILFVAFLLENPLAQKTAVGVMLIGLLGLGAWMRMSATGPEKPQER